MNILLCALNSKFIHSSLAIRSLVAYCGEFNEHITIKEFTINNSEDFILSEIYKLKPDVLCFSAYIWNIEFIKALCSSLKKVLPKTIIIIGGPEVSYSPEELLACHADIIAMGEGEGIFKELVSYVLSGTPLLSAIKGIAYTENGIMTVNEEAVPIALDEIPFVYADLTDLENKIIYYESSRGCPFSCGYCLSSASKGVKFLSLNRVYADLDFFITNKLRQVKFVDRTFNCNKPHAMAIWKYITNNDNHHTNFHFEISADLLDDEMLQTLSTARKGLIQLEIGVQSTNINTLNAVSRKTDLNEIYEKVIQIRGFGNIHQHLDLIAGLPLENYESFTTSFNQVFALKPEMLQLGFLKLLKGSALRCDADKLGIVYKNAAPYEVLYTKQMPYEQMLRLKNIESMVEIYYNAGRFRKTLAFAIKQYESPFAFFEQLADYWEQMGHHLVSHNKAKIFFLLYDFLCIKLSAQNILLKNLLKFDMFINENVKNLPDWMDKTDYTKIKPRLDRFYYDEQNRAAYFPELEHFTPRQIGRMLHIEGFDFDILGDLEPKPCFILFHYGQEAQGSETKAFSVEI